MADGTKIEWTDATWNIVTGCSVVSPGCTSCYAMKLAGTRLRNIPSRAGLTADTKAGPVWNGEVRFNREWLADPLNWRRPRRIFVCAHGDIFHESVPDEWIDQVFAVMALAPQHTFQVLTKRAERMRDYCRRLDENGRHPAMVQAALLALTGRWNTPPLDLRAWPLPNVWKGVSAEDQRRANERIPILIETPAAVRWVSAEPLLGPIDFSFFRQPNMGGGPWWFDALDEKRAGWFADEAATIPTDDWRDHSDDVPRLDWVVVGGESGRGARPMHYLWARSIRDQCAAAGVPFLFKQWGEWAPICEIDTDAMHERLYHPRLAYHGLEGPRRCKVAQCILHADGARFDLDEWSRTHPSAGAGVHAAGSGHMLTMAIGKKASGRRLDGVLHDGYPQCEEIPFG